MHAQTTTTPAQANEATPPAALKTKTRALKSKPTLTEAVDAARAYKAGEYARAKAKHNEAEIEVQLASSALGGFPFPAELTVPAKPPYLVSMAALQVDGSLKSAEFSRPTVKLESVEAILAHFDGSPEEAAPALAKLKAWSAATADLRACLAKADAVETKAERAWSRALSESSKLATAILNAPAQTPDEMLLKLSAYAEALSDSGSMDVAKLDFHDDATPALIAIFNDLQRMAVPAARRNAAQALGVAA